MRNSGSIAKAWLLPSLADVLLVALVIRPLTMSGGFDKLVGDANLGLQLRAGDLFRAQGTLTQTDPFSFALPGKIWHAWEWLFDVLASMVHEAAGLEALAVCAVACIAGTFALTLYSSLRESGSIAVGVAVMLAGFHACTIHTLARPFLVSWVLLAITVRVVQSGRREWILIPMCALWANLHGGFFTLPVFLTLLAAGEWFEDRTLARRHALIAAGCLAASLLNPLGYRLHAHILGFLLSGWQTAMVQEFLPPSRQLGEAFWFFLIFASVALGAAAGLAKRRRFGAALVILFFALSAARSARHIPVFVILTAPLVAGEVARWWSAFLGKDAKGGSWQTAVQSLEADFRPQFAHYSLWIPALLCAALLFPRAFGVPADFDKNVFPRDLVARQMPQLMDKRIFTTDLWADYLIYHGAPRIRIWVSGNNDFFGPELGEEYLEILDGGAGTAALVAKWRFDAFLVSPGSGAARWVRRQAGWRSVDRTAKAELFLKEQGRPEAALHDGLSASVMAR